MANFQIPHIVPTSCKTVSFPDDLIKDVKQAIDGKKCTFSAFVIAAVRYALEQLDGDNDKGKGT